MFARPIAMLPTTASATGTRKPPFRDAGPAKSNARVALRSMGWDLGRVAIHPPDTPISAVPGNLNAVPRDGGRPLDPAIRASFEPSFRRDFSAVRVHSDATAGASAAQVNALAYTVGNNIVFSAGQYRPGTTAGRELIAHELAHVVQQSGGAQVRSAGQADPAALEAQADRAASAVMNHAASPSLSLAPISPQRRVSIRDVGRGEQSGIARAGELVARLNRMSAALTFAITSGFLTYTRKPGATPNEFDNQMMRYIDDAADIPMRMTNRHGLMGTRATGFNIPVGVDDYLTGYVDIDDLLASSDLGLQTSLVHLLRERQQTRDYARRLGSPSLNTAEPGPAREFERSHASGIDAELQVLRGFFSDPSIRIVDANTRLFRNDRRDLIRERETAGGGAAQQGSLAISWVVVLHDTHRVISAEEYRDILAAERRPRAGPALAPGQAPGPAEHR